MNKLEKNKFIDDKINYLQNMMIALKRIKSGESETAVLKDLNINKSKFRNMMYKDWGGYEEPQINQTFGSIFSLPTLNGAERLFCDIAGITLNSNSIEKIPSDVDKTMSIAMKTLKNREKKILYMYYYECMTLREIGKVIGVTQQRVRDIKSKALRKLRHPSRFSYIRAGEEFYSKCKEIRIEKEHLRQQQCAKQLAGFPESKAKDDCKNKEHSSENPNDITLEQLNLSVRSYNALARFGIRDLNDIEQLTVKELSKIRNLGKKSVREILSILHEHGLTLEDE